MAYLSDVCYVTYVMSRMSPSGVTWFWYIMHSKGYCSAAKYECDEESSNLLECIHWFLQFNQGFPPCNSGKIFLFKFNLVYNQVEYYLDNTKVNTILQYFLVLKLNLQGFPFTPVED